MYWIKVENVFCNIKKYPKRVLPGSFYVNGHNLGFIHTLQSENCLLHHDKQHPRIVPVSTIFLVNGHTKAFHFRFKARTTLQRTINSKSTTLTIASVFHPLKSWPTDSKLRTVFFHLINITLVCYYWSFCPQALNKSLPRKDNLSFHLWVTLNSFFIETICNLDFLFFFA